MISLVLVSTLTHGASALPAVSFSPKSDYPTATGPTSVAVADLNADGRPDLVVANGGSHTVSVRLGTGGGSFGAKVDYSAGTGPSGVAIRDLNGDGHADLAVSSDQAATVSVLLGNGNGTFAPQTTYAVAGNSPAIVAADLTRDGLPDLVAACQSANVVSVLPGVGNGTFGTRVDHATAGPKAVAVADVNGDGRNDLVAVNGAASTVSVWSGNANGTLAPPTSYATGTNPHSVAIGDLSGDSRPDLVVTNQTPSTVSVLLGTFSGFAPRIDYATGASPTVVVVGDLNGDGRRDVAVASTNAHAVSVLLGNGDGTLAPRIDFAVASGPRSVASADLNGDGKPDLATANAISFSASVRLNTSPGPLLGGMPHALLGNASVDVSNGVMTVSNLGTSGNDGIAVATGPLRLPSKKGAGFGFVADIAYAGVIPEGGATLTAQVLGTRASLPNQVLGTMAAALDPSGLHSLDLDFAASAPGPYAIAIYDGNQLVHQTTGHSGVGIAYEPYQTCDPWSGANALVVGDPIPGVDINLEQVPGGIVANTRFKGCTEFDLGDGSGPHDGDRLLITGATSTLSAGDALTDIRVTSSLPSFTVTREAPRIFGAVHDARGDVRIGGSTGPVAGIVARNIGSSGNDGIRVAVPSGRKALHVGFGGRGFAPGDAGASLLTRALGTVAGVPNTPLFGITQTARTDGVDIAASFTGATVESVLVLDGGASIHRVELPNGTVVRQVAPANQTFAAGDPIPGVDINLEQVPGGIAGPSGKGRTALLTYRDVRTFDIGGVLRSGRSLIFKRAFVRGIATDADDDTTAVLTDVDFLATNPGSTNLDSLEIVNEIMVHDTATTGVDPVDVSTGVSMFWAPNPFRSSARLRFELPGEAHVRVAIFDLSGRRVRTLHTGSLSAGPHVMGWDGRDDDGRAAGQGVYFARLERQGRTSPAKIVRME